VICQIATRRPKKWTSRRAGGSTHKTAKCTSRVLEALCFNITYSGTSSKPRDLQYWPGTGKRLSKAEHTKRHTARQSVHIQLHARHNIYIYMHVHIYIYMCVMLNRQIGTEAEHSKHQYCGRNKLSNTAPPRSCMALRALGNIRACTHAPDEWLILAPARLG